MSISMGRKRSRVGSPAISQEMLTPILFRAAFAGYYSP